MNVLLRNFLTLVFLISGVALMGQSIVTLNLETYGNTGVEYQFSSMPGPASVHEDPVNGQVQLNNLGSFNWEVIYTPDEDYYGSDNFELYFFSGTLKKLKVQVDVLPAKVVAFRDYSSTDAGTPVTVEVLANDFSSNDVFILSAIPAVNNGWAEFEAGASTITFHPDAGFSGLTHLNYVVCDGAGTCDNGTVSITVMPTVSENDTLRIFTKKTVVVVRPTHTNITQVNQERATRHASRSGTTYLQGEPVQKGISDNSDETPV